MRAGRGFTLFISNEDLNDIPKIVKSLEDSGVLIEGITETVKHEIKTEEGEFLVAFLATFSASIVQPVIFLVVKGIGGRGLRREGREYMNKNS